MATLNEVFNAANTLSELRNRTAAAIAQQAWTIFAEETPVQARIDWAKDAISNCEGMAKNWVWGVCGNVTVQNTTPPFTPTDGDIEYIVSEMVNDFAAPAA